MNRITIIGHVGQDPERREYKDSNGETQPIAAFTVAVNQRRSGQQAEPDWFNVKVFGRQAEPVLQYVSKGRQVGVHGRMQSNRVTKDDGTKVTYWDLVADEVEFLGSGDGQQAAAAQGSDVTPQPAAAGTGLPF